MSNNFMGRWSAFALFLIGIAYGIALLVGFATRGLSAPIVDPLLAVMELLTLIAAPCMLVMVAAVHGRTRENSRTMGSIAFAFMVLAAGTTSVVHFIELTAMRQLGTAGLVWPSPAYALELLAWDVFLGLSLVFAAFAFENAGRERKLRRGLLACGTLCFIGIIGPVVGNMRLQLVGVFGYGVAFPIVCLLLSEWFRGDAHSVA
jgi:hypothetical protein